MKKKSGCERLNKYCRRDNWVWNPYSPGENQSDKIKSIRVELGLEVDGPGSGFAFIGTFDLLFSELAGSTFSGPVSQ